MTSRSIDVARVLQDEETLRIGQVVEVSGRTVRVEVDSQKNSTHFTYRGDVVRGVAVGTFLRLLRGPLEIIGRVEGEVITEGKADRRTLRRLLTVGVVGKFSLDGRFVGGVAELPLISNPAYLLPSEEAQALFAFVERGQEAIKLGTLLENSDEHLLVDADRLLASHVGVFGNTGSGKSNTLALLLAEVARKYQKSKRFRRRARFVVLDFNGEYLSREGSRTPISAYPAAKADFDLGNPHARHNRLVLPLEGLDDSELWAVLLEATQKTQTPLIRRALKNQWLLAASQSDALLRDAVFDILMQMTEEVNSSVERNSPAALLESIQTAFADVLEPEEFDTVLEFLRSRLILNTTTQGFYVQDQGNAVYTSSPRFRILVKEAVDSAAMPAEALSAVQAFYLRLVLQYHLEIARGYENREYLAPLIKRAETRLSDLSRVLEFSDDEPPRAPFRVVSLARLAPELQRVVAVLVAKSEYERQRTQGPRDGHYLALVIDEAHNVLSRQAANESDQWRDYRLAVFETIVKEGRKFGAFMFVSSQRPYDISPTVLSQLHNFFLHRLVNTRDIEAIQGLVPYLDRLSFEQIPLLPTGVCVVTGLVVERPVLVTIRLLKKTLRPVSETLRPTSWW